MPLKDREARLAYARTKQRHKTAQSKAYRRAYQQRPEYKAAKKEQRSQPGRKAATRELQRKRNAELPDDEHLRRKAYNKQRQLARTATSRANPFGAHLYIMKRSDLEGVFKVGRAADPNFRAFALANGHLFKMVVVLVYPDMGKHETVVHDALAPFKIRGDGSGREWYKIEEQKIIELVRHAISQFEH